MTKSFCCTSPACVSAKIMSPKTTLSLPSQIMVKDLTRRLQKSKGIFGLVGMKEQVLLMKGKLVTESIIGKGTAITVSIPV